MAIGAGTISVIINNLRSADETRATGNNEVYSLNDWVYCDPKNGADCSISNYWTPFDQNTTCYRWSVFTDDDTASDSTIKLILDHNIAHADFTEKDAAMNNIVNTWEDYAGTASFATEAEIMNAMRLDYSPTLSNNSINGGEKNTNLMANNCYYLNGAKVNHAGFWTTNAYDDTHAYTFTEFGNNSVVESTKSRGVRPVIIADKSKLTAEPSKKDITSTVLNSASNKYLHSSTQYGGSNL